MTRTARSLAPRRRSFRIAPGLSGLSSRLVSRRLLSRPLPWPCLLAALAALMAAVSSASRARAEPWLLGEALPPIVYGPGLLVEPLPPIWLGANPANPAGPAAPPSPLASAAANSALPAANGAIAARLDSLWVAGDREVWRALSEQSRQAARALGDSVFLDGLLVSEGSRALSLGQALRAEPLLREAVALAEARGDSVTLTAAVRWLSVAVGSLGKMPEARALYRRLGELARARGDRRHEGWALVGMAWDAWREGRAEEARRDYQQAVALFQAAGETEGEIWAQNGLGTAWSRGGDYAAARAAYTRAAELARAADFSTVELMALNNLGSLEYRLGDPGLAEMRFQRARVLARERGQEREIITPGVNLAMCRSDLGRLHESAAMLDSCLEEARSAGYGDLEALVLSETASLRERQERTREARRLYRQVLALGETAAIEVRVRSAVGLAAALAAADSAGAALDVLARRERWFKDRTPNDLEVQFRAAFGRHLIEAGKPREALAQLRAAAALSGSLGLASWRVEALAEAARCERALGRPDSALAGLEAAARAWEQQRGLPLDPRWREQRGAAGHLLYGELADLLLGPGEVVTDPERVRQAFDSLQPFKARTLLERMAGPGRDPERRPAGTVTLAELQAGVLQPGELLLDFYLGPDFSFLFAATRDEARAARLPAESDLADRLRLYYELLAAPPPVGARPAGARPAGAAPAPAAVRAESAAQRAETEAGAALARDLLGSVADLAAAASRVVVSPDGALHLMPFGELPLAVASPRGGEPAPAEALLERCEIVRVPSATILARVRRSAPPADAARTARSAPPGRDAGGPLHVLAVAGGGGAGGRPLDGARLEVQELGRRYRGVTVRAPGIDTTAVSVQDLAAADILHLAAHLHVDDQHPWRTRLRIQGRGDAPEGAAGAATPERRATQVAGAAGAADVDTAGLSAAEVLTLPLRARLAFLSSCGTATGRILSGEGVLGLTGAFLAAGTPAAIATLWPVDDVVTARFVSEFYRGLAQGLPAAAALRRSQLEMRADPATSAPFYWAGFVLAGDGSVRAKLMPRRPWERWLSGSSTPGRTAVLLLAVLASIGTAVTSAIVRARRRRVAAFAARRGFS